MVAKAAKRDRKAYQAAYYQRNKKSLNARRTAARRNAKSFLIAVVLLAHLCGSMRGANWMVAVVSLTGRWATSVQVRWT